MPWIDDVIGWWNPRAGYKRARDRLAMRQIRSYEAARNDRRTAGWISSNTSANAEIGPAISRLINRSREQVQNNPYATRAIASMVSNAIGTGITAKMDTAQDVWKTWTEECDAEGQHDFYGLQALAARTAFESGSALIRLRARRPEDGLTVPLQLQVMEPDFLDYNKTMALPNGGRIVYGVELDPLDRRAAYWLFPRHPGDIAQYSAGLQSRRVPADQVLHIYEKLRPSQLLGVPKLASALMKMRELDDYEDAELMRKKIEACFAGFVTSPEDSAAIGQQVTTDGKTVESLEPGLIQYLRPGEEITFGTPGAAVGYAEYTRTQLHAIAAGAGITYEQLTGDLSQVNYSSMRAGMTEFRRMMSMWQWLTFIPMFCAPVARAFATTGYLSGVIKQPKIDAEWTTPKWDYVNPAEDVQASKEAIKGGLKSLSECVREQGYDPLMVFAEISEERKLLASLGIKLDTDIASIPAATSTRTGAKA